MQKTGKTYVVGVGASAGGLEAITQLIGNLKVDSPCAYVVLQHLSPTYRSMMVEILGRETSLSVKEAADGDTLKAGVIYVVPSNFNALYKKEGQLQLVPAVPEIVPKPSINQFLISLAAEEGDCAIGIVLSGTGSDGVAGLRAIQAAGGFTFVQKPETAKYDGMPRAAIDAGVVDHILSPEEIAHRLPQILALPHDESDNAPPDLLNDLLTRIRERLQFDFSGYKVGTLMRRIRRREVATGHLDLASYLTWVEKNPHELDLLARDILISVTAFFRDRDAFESLRRAVADIYARRDGQEIRVWVAGCASGEEAYSIAMLFAEALGEKLAETRVQIFATDIDDDALNIARRGLYPAAAMTEVHPELLQRYFHLVNQAYEANKNLRDMIVFARHNLVSDPPFLRLDLVSCRNVLIYFDAPLQAKVLQTFHFGLKPSGYIFLGRSESVAQTEHLFATVERRDRLFMRSGEAEPLPERTILSAPIRAPYRDRTVESLLKALVGHFAATALLCDAEGNIQHTVGSVERFLVFPVGASRLTLADVALTSLRGELLTLMHRAVHTGHRQQGRRRKLGKDHFRIYVEPVNHAGTPLWMILFILEKIDKNRVEAPLVPPNKELEDELVATREHLQSLVEEMATANEEMQALNEEAQASNEELQATNEELEAANEELQATNEELFSLNEELNVKTTELSRLAEEYAHLYDALQFPIFMFDRALNLIRFNAPGARRFDLRPTALHQHISRLRMPPPLKDFELQLERSLAQADRVESTLSWEERIFQLTVVPGLDKTGEVTNLVASLIDVTDIAQARAQLAESEARLSALLQSTTIIFAMKDLRGAYLFANRTFLEFFQLDADNYLGKTDFELLPRQLAADFWGLDLTALREKKLARGERRVEIGASTRQLKSLHQVLYDTAGRPIGFAVEAQDVTKARHAEAQLRITARVFDKAGEAIVVTDPERNIQTVNDAFSRITGYAADEVIGAPLTFLESDLQTPEFYQEIWQALKTTGFWQGEIAYRHKDGRVCPQWYTVNRIDSEAGETEHYVALFSDISQIKETQRRVEYLATHDTLTGLPNRKLFLDRLKHCLAHARRQKNNVALLFIDLDNFKNVNDTLGHDVGDAVLRLAGARLSEVVRDGDTVARVGGDEFTAILDDCDYETANHVAQRIIDDLSASFEIDKRSIFLSASIGVTFYPDDGDSSGSLIKAADSAMYRAKEQGRNRVEFFTPDLQVRLLKSAAMEGALREAMRKKRLRLAFQPKFRIRDEHLVGAEALIRWHDPVLGEVSPSEFIAVAESSGLILELADLVQGLLLEQVANWVSADFAPPPIAFNISPRSLREKNYAKALIEKIAVLCLPTEHLQVEITEGALLDYSANVAENLSALHAAGLRIAIDDFGTGYSSLSYLKRLPLHELKIDKSFVDGLGQDKEDEAIARAVLGLAHALELQTMAEGVENEKQLIWLKDHGCDIVQGYYFSKPLEARDFEQMIAKKRRYA